MLVQRRQSRLGQAGDQLLQARGIAAGAHGDLGAGHRHEGRTEAVHATVVLVAGGLVDPALAPELGFQRQDADAIGLHRAVAAAFAHLRVDEYALVGSSA